MRVWPILLLAACTDGPVTGSATSSLHPEARSSAIFVDNVALIDPPGTYRRWTVEIGDAAAGTSCSAIGDPIIAIDLYTIFDSAPRGLIPLSPLSAPIVLFPAAYATVVDGVTTQGTVDISAAATTSIIGTVSGIVTNDRGTFALDVTFDAKYCSQ